MGFMDSKTLFTKISPVRLFFIASVPGAISMLASALYQVIDGILVGQILGELAFAALNLAMPFVIINFSLADLIGVGSAVPISVSLGKRETKRADNIFTCACILIVGAGVLIGGVLYLLAVPLLRLMGAEGELLHLSVQYLQVYAICAPVTTIIFAVDNYLRICGKIKSSMFLNIFMYAEGFVQPLLYGMCDSLQPAVSYNLGAGNKKRIQAIEKCCYTASGVVSLLSAAVLFFFPDVITRMFVSSPDAVFLEMARGGGSYALCSDLSDQMVFFCHTKLYGCCGKSRGGSADFRIHGADFSSAFSGGSLASGAYGNLAEFCRDIGAGRDHVGSNPEKKFRKT